MIGNSIFKFCKKFWDDVGLARRHKQYQKDLGFEFPRDETIYIDHNHEYFYSGDFLKTYEKTKARIQELRDASDLDDSLKIILLDEFNYCAEKINPIYGRENTVLQEMMDRNRDSFNEYRKGFFKYVDTHKPRDSLTLAGGGGFADFDSSVYTTYKIHCSRLTEKSRLAFAGFAEVVEQFKKIDRLKTEMLDRGDEGALIIEDDIEVDGVLLIKARNFWEMKEYFFEGKAKLVSCMRGEHEQIIEFFEAVYNLDTYGEEKMPSSGGRRVRTDIPLPEGDGNINTGWGGLNPVRT